MADCEHCENALRIYRNIGNLMSHDHVYFKCDLGRNKDACGSPVAVTHLQEPIAQKVTVIDGKRGSDNLNQDEINMLVNNTK